MRSGSLAGLLNTGSMIGDPLPDFTELESGSKPYPSERRSTGKSVSIQSGRGKIRSS